MRDQQGFTEFASARAGDLRRQAYLLTGSPERAVRLADKALADTGRRWDKLGGTAAAEEHARRVVAAGAVRGRGVAPTVAVTPRGTAAPTDDAGEAVRRALAGLPPRRRAVLVLRYDEGLDDAAVGARLGVPATDAAAEGEAGLATLRSLLRRRGRPEELLPTALAQTPLPTPVTHTPPTLHSDTHGTETRPDTGTDVGVGDGAGAPSETSVSGGGPPATRVAARAGSGAGGMSSPAAAPAAGAASPAAGAASPAAGAAAPAAVPAAGAESSAAPSPIAAPGVETGPAASDAEAGPDEVRSVPGEGEPGQGAASPAGAAPARDRRRGWVVAAIVAVLVGVGAGVLVPVLRDGSAGAAGPVPASTGTAPALLPWPARGTLAGDQDLLRSALRAWQTGVPDRQRPVRSAALWAGDLDGVRTVLLQGTDASGQSWLAQVIGSGDTASLRSTEPLGRAVPLLALGTIAGTVHLLADPDADPDSLLAAVGGTLRPLAVGHDSLSQGVTAPSAGLRVVLTDGGAVVGSGTVLPGRLSPVTGTVELTRSTLDLGPAQAPVQAWFDDGELVGRRLGGPVELVQVGPVRATSVRVNARPTRLEARAYEVVRGGTRYLATVIRAGATSVCTDTAPVGPADSVPAKPIALVARCIPRGGADGVLAAVGTRGVRSVRVTLAPATPAMPGRPGVPGRPARSARAATITGTSGAGLVGLFPVSALPTAPLPAVARDAANHPLAHVTLPAYRGPRP
jgi:DNA-directed RNA polymerase specialized sigma24 family protein